MAGMSEQQVNEFLDILQAEIDKREEIKGEKHESPRHVVMECETLGLIHAKNSFLRILEGQS